MRERITNAYWKILVLYLLFFNANAELKQESRVIITEKPTLCMQKRTIRKSSKLVLYYNSSSDTQTLILSGATEANLGPAYKNRNERKEGGVSWYIKDSNERRGGRVGWSIKDSIEYKVRHDLNKIDESIEHLWIECKGNNCNKSYLVAALYQPSWDEKEKLIWIKKLDTLLSIVSSTWNKTIIITGDTTTDYLKSSAAFKRYKEVIETYNLSSTLLYQRVKGLKPLIISSPT